jgi:hypothetical protein
MGRGAARRAWRRRGEPIVGLWNRVVSVAGIAEREDLTVEPPRPETRNWRRKGLKRLDPRPESPKTWYWERHDRRPEQFPSPLAR